MPENNSIFRPATYTDLPEIIDLLANDALGAKREDNRRPLNPRYEKAFAAIDADHNNQLIVVEANQNIIGVVQLTILPNLTYRGASRALIEGVRIHSEFRGQGLGRQIFEWAIEQAKCRGCHLVQLTSDKRRPDAIRFYESLGFKATHEGMKLVL